MSTGRFAVVIVSISTVERVTVGRPDVPATKIAVELMLGEVAGPDFKYNPDGNPRFTPPPEEPPPPDEPPAE